MSLSLAERYRRVAATFTDVAVHVSPAGWDSPAPCEGWTGRDVVRHLVEWFPAFLESAGGPLVAPGPDVETDPVGAWRAMDDAVQAVLDDPASHETWIDHPRAGRHRLDEAVGTFLLGDVLIHTWDLARADGRDVTLEPSEAEGMLAGLRAIEDLLRASGQYGAAVAVPDDADLQTQLIAFTGRRP